VRLYHVSKAYQAGSWALRDVSLELEKGDLAFVTGASGAGKTTLMRLVFAAERPSEGQILVLGRNVGRLGVAGISRLRRRIGVVFQEFRLLDHLSAFENVALPLRLAGRSVGDYRKDVEELLSWVGLGERLEDKPPTLSGGEQQRVAIARAVVAKPDILLADEPTGNVDPDIGERLIRLFVELNRFGTTVMIATHDRALIESTRARELRLVDGKVIEMRGLR
jgi:cell division transport system ATP-binding protein